MIKSTDLIKQLRTQISSTGKLKFDSTLLEIYQLEHIQVCWGIKADEFLTIDNLLETDIVVSEDNSISITNGTIAIAGFPGISLNKLTFIVTDTVEFILHTIMPSDWKLQDSFPGLAMFPFNRLTQSNSSLIYSSAHIINSEINGTAILTGGISLQTDLMVRELETLKNLLGDRMPAMSLKTTGFLQARRDLPYPLIRLSTDFHIPSFNLLPGLSLTGLQLLLEVTEPGDELVQDFRFGIIAQASEMDLMLEIDEDGDSLEISGNSHADSSVSISTLGNSTVAKAILPTGTDFNALVPAPFSNVISSITLNSFDILLSLGSTNVVEEISFSLSGPTINVGLFELNKFDFETTWISPTAETSTTQVNIKAQGKVPISVFTQPFDFNISVTKNKSWVIDSIEAQYTGIIPFSAIIDSIASGTKVPATLKGLNFGDFLVKAEPAGQSFTCSCRGMYDCEIMSNTFASTFWLIFNKNQEGVTFNLTAGLILGETSFRLQANLQKSAISNSFGFIADADQIPLSDLAENLFKGLGIDIEYLPQVVLDKITLYYNTPEDGTLRIEAGSTLNKKYKGTFELTAKKNDEGKWELSSVIGLGFTDPLGGLKISEILKDSLKKVFPNYQEVIPEGFIPEFTVQNVYINYDGKTGKTNLLASTTAAGKAVKFFFQYAARQQADPGSKSNYTFGIETDVADLGGLPLVGESLKEVKFSHAGFVYTSAESSFAMPSLTVEGAEKTLSFAEPKLYQKGFNFTGQLDVSPNFAPFSLTLPMVPSSPELNNSAVAVSKPSYQPGVKWLNVNKGIGPVKLNKVGFSYSDNMLSLVLNADVTFSAVTFSLDGLGFAFSPTNLIKGENIKPEFRLAGLGLSIKKEPLEISGMFMKVEPQKGEDIAFYGTAKISTSKFSIAGIGSYSKSGNDAAFFIYAMYNGPIGGPAFFFVTGIAAGFGYNKKIRLPEVQQVKDFPLVSMALNPDGTQGLEEVLDKLITGSWITTSPGDYWLAIGIKFTTFKIVESFVLLTVEFGTKLQFAIMGLSVLKWPNEGTALVYVELAVLARFGPDSDVIAVRAVLTPNSYVFDKNCKLTGGFAFYTWISGEHEGDFVITMGGYHPRYQVPAHYPQVDRLALNWKIGSTVTISGDMYYALTPSVIMAGGRWNVLCDLSFLKASVTVFADVLISWAPFYYQIDGGIIVRIEADIDILFVTVHFKLSMGAEVHIWGPPFAGEIYVDWSIFSFTIPFGANKKPERDLLKWADFEKQFIPLKDGLQHPLDTRIIAGVTEVIRDENGAVLDTIVDPYHFAASVDSFFPVTEIYKDKDHKHELEDETWMEVAGQDHPTYLKDRNNSFGIKPMGQSLQTKLHGTLQLKNQVTGAYEEVKENIRLVAGAKGMASALWGQHDNDDTVLKNVVAGLQFQTTEAVDTSIVSFKPDFLKKPIKKQVSFLRNSDAYGKLEPEKIAEEIRLHINHEEQKNIVESLTNLGFDLPAPVELNYENLNMDTPLFLAAIGQNITDIIEA